MADDDQIAERLWTQYVRRNRVYTAITTERDRQDELKAAGKFLYTCADSQLLSADKYLVLGEEFGEVGRAILNMKNLSTDYQASLDDVRKELVQLAAVSVAWLEFIEGVLHPDTGFVT